MPDKDEEGKLLLQKCEIEFVSLQNFAKAGDGEIRHNTAFKEEISELAKRLVFLGRVPPYMQF